MSSNLIYITSFILINIFIISLCIKRSKNESPDSLEASNGCIAFGYFGSIVFIVNVFTLGTYLSFCNALKDNYEVMTSGKNYTATIIDFTIKKIYDSDSASYYERRIPTVIFVDDKENSIKAQLDFSSSLEIGDTYKINYNSKNEKVIALGFTLIANLLMTFAFCFIFSFLFIGEMLYIFNRKMEKYFSLMKKVSLFFLFPLVILGFIIALIYFIFYG